MEVVQFPGLGLTFNISRVAFTIGNFNIYWYGLLIGAGLLLAMLYALKQSREFGLDQNKFMDAIIWGVIGGVIGARLYYVAFTPRDDFSTLKSILDIRNGGMGFYGAVIGGVLAVWIVSRIEKIKLAPMLDLVGIGFLIGQGIGRWGNFMNQEAFGTNTDLPWGMLSGATQRYISLHSEEIMAHGMHAYQFSPVHPTFLYESLWCILGFIILAVYAKHRKFDGEIFLMFLVWNGSLRMFLEGIRLDSLYIGNIRVSQLLAAIMAFGALALIVLIRNRIKMSADPEFMKPYGHTAAWEEEYRSIVEKEENRKNNKRSVKKVIEEDALTEEKAEVSETVDAAEERSEPEKVEEEAEAPASGPEAEAAEPAAEKLPEAAAAAEPAAEEAVTEEKPAPAKKRSSGSSASKKKTSASKKTSGGSKKSSGTSKKSGSSKKAAEAKPEGAPAEIAAAAVEAAAEPEKVEVPAEIPAAEVISEAVPAEETAAEEPKKAAPTKKSSGKKSSGTRSSGSKSSGSKSSSAKSSSAKSSSGTSKKRTSSKKAAKPEEKPAEAPETKQEEPAE